MDLICLRCTDLLAIYFIYSWNLSIFVKLLCKYKLRNFVTKSIYNTGRRKHSFNTYYEIIETTKSNKMRVQRGVKVYPDNTTPWFVDVK